MRLHAFVPNFLEVATRNRRQHKIQRLQRTVGTAQQEIETIVVVYANAIDVAQPTGGARTRIPQAFVGIGEVVGGEFFAIVKLHALADFDGDGKALFVFHHAPGFRQPIDALQLRRNRQQSFVEEIDVVAIHAGGRTCWVYLLGFGAERDDDFFIGIRCRQLACADNKRQHESKRQRTAANLLANPNLIE